MHAFTPSHRCGSGPPLGCLNGFTDTWPHEVPCIALRARSDTHAVMQVNDAVLEPALIEKLELPAD